jgi:hypothetical protein
MGPGRRGGQGLLNGYQDSANNSMKGQLVQGQLTQQAMGFLQQAQQFQMAGIPVPAELQAAINRAMGAGVATGAPAQLAPTAPSPGGTPGVNGSAAPGSGAAQPAAASPSATSMTPTSPSGATPNLGDMAVSYGWPRAAAVVDPKGVLAVAGKNAEMPPEQKNSRDPIALNYEPARTC